MEISVPTNKFSIIIIAAENDLVRFQSVISNIRNYSGYVSYEIIVVENNCSIELKEWIAEQTYISPIFNDKTLDIPVCYKLGLEIASGNKVIFFKNIVLVEENWIENIGWKYNESITIVNVENEIIQSINSSNKGSFRVLELGCSYGATLLELRRQYPQVELYGIESFPHAAEVSGLIADVRVGEPELVCDEFANEYFDLIIIGDYFHKMKSPLETFKILKDLLKVDGELLIRVNNLLHISVIRDLLNGSLESSSLNHSTLPGIISKLEEARFEELDINYVRNLNEQDEGILTEIKQLSSIEVHSQFEIDRFILGARKELRENVIFEVLNKLDYQSADSEYVEKALQFDARLVLQVIDSRIETKLRTLNILAVASLERKQLEDVLLYLNQAYQYDSSDFNTLLNLATVMHSINENELALRYLEAISEKNEQIKDWIQEINKKIIDDRYEKLHVKFLLRNIEHDVNRVEATAQILNLIKENRIELSYLTIVIDNEIIEKTELINRLAVECFQCQLYEWVIPLLEKSLQYDPYHSDTLYNLGYVLYSLGEHANALEFLGKIADRDQEVNEFMDQIKEEMVHE
ncbi:methyltransferase domain-containing protein [Bacillus sp. 3255]|uniref:methyltransferase domain-containing protein n=1 Tax=Bacillus sp. 3255 TaxID=2817904 RepID=UPI0028587EC6|nr:methyltransferase domain-containing protein [Bacillus sp. 3255]MDR6883471.1 SAM-dependent methyltransferase [Bacillus sp. 3255]